MIEVLTVGCHVDYFVVVALRFEVIDAFGDGFNEHYHTRTSAELVIIQLFMFIRSVVPNIVDMYLKQSFLLCPFQDGVFKWAFQKFRNGRKDVYSHFKLTNLF